MWMIYRCSKGPYLSLRGFTLFKFLRGSVRFSPDIYLDELQEMLEERLGVSAGQSTIWRALRKSGFTMKKVHSGFCLVVADSRY